MPRRLLRRRRQRENFTQDWSCIEHALNANNISDIDAVKEKLETYGKEKWKNSTIVKNCFLQSVELCIYICMNKLI